MIRAFYFALLLSVLPAVLAPGAPPVAPRSAGPTKADLALSASFAPPRYVVRDSVQRARLERFLRGARRDADDVGERGEWYRMGRNSVTLSHGLLERFAAEDGASDSAGRTRLRRGRARLEREAGVSLEESRVAFPASYVPNDFGLETATPQWGLRNDGSHFGSVAGMDIGMDKVWERFDGSDTLVIAVLDAGYNFHHPDLQNRWYVNQAEANGLPGVDDDGNGFIDDIRGWDFVDEDNDPHDFHYHGTQISGIIAASFDNAAGVAGMLPRVKILPVRVLSTAGYGYTEDIAAGIRYAAKMGAHVANFSIGIGGSAIDTMLYNAFVAARDSGMIIAAATGNDALNLDITSRQPSSYGLDNVYSIAAHVTNGALAGFSNYGPTKADLAAPGVDIATTTIPPAITLYQEGFENFNASNWTITQSSGNPSWQVATDSMEGTKAFKWIAGTLATATLLDTMTMRDRRGGLLKFRLNYTPSTAWVNDYLFLEYQAKGSANWIYFAAVGSAVTGQTLAFNLGPMDDTLYRIRIRACRFTSVTGAGVVNCNSMGTATNRVIRIDDLKISYADENLANQAAYESYGGGTSLAAPYFAGYAGLMRLATARMGVPLTRSLMLAGTTTVPALAGKVATGGRLDAAKGLDFYLKTLPRVKVDDSLTVSWPSGSSASYYFRATDTNGVSLPDFVFTGITLPSGAMFEPEGDFWWNTTGHPLGSYLVRVKGAHGAHVIRKMQSFTVSAPVPTELAEPQRQSRLRIGGRAFVLPASAFAAGGPRRLRIEFYDIDGRTLRTLDGELTLPMGGRVVEYDLTGFRAPGLRAWLNGVPLRPAARE